jgi:hypothetical protein
MVDHSKVSSDFAGRGHGITEIGTVPKQVNSICYVTLFADIDSELVGVYCQAKSSAIRKQYVYPNR